MTVSPRAGVRWYRAIARVAPSILLAAWLPSAAASPDCLDYEDYLHWVAGVETPGSCEDVAIEGSLACVADGAAGLQVIDIADPENPVLLGGAGTTGQAWRVAIEGSLALVADGAGALQVIDIAHPENPQLLGSVEVGPVSDVVVEGTLAFVTGSGLHVVDVATPASPQIVGTIDVPDARDVAVHDARAYVLTRGGPPHAPIGNLVVVDVSSPKSPEILGMVELATEATDVVIEGNLAFVSGSRLYVIDISEPDHPWIVSHLSASASRVAVSGGIVYLAQSRGLLTVDATVLTRLRTIGYLSILPIDAVAVTNGHAFVAGRDGLQVIDVTVAESAPFVGSLEVPGGKDVAISGDHAFVAGRGFQVVDLANPADPQLIGPVPWLSTAFSSPPRMETVVVSGAYAYVGDRSTVYVVDISDPENARITGRVSGFHFLGRVAVSGAYAYVAADDLYVVDISNPENPQIVGLVSTWGGRDVWVSGDFAYVTAGGVVQVIDIGDPESPQLVGNVAAGGRWRAVVDGFAYASVNGLHVIDLSTPTDPQVVGRLPMPRQVTDVTVAGGFAYLADGFDGLHVVDISNPADPRLIGTLPGSMQRVAIADDYVVALGGDRLHLASRACDPIVRAKEDPGDVDVIAEIPEVNVQLAVRPNPFNPRTTVDFSLPRAGRVTVVIFDPAGRRVRTLASGNLPAGSHALAWDGRDSSGHAVSSGMYILRLATKDRVETRKMTVLR